MECMKCLNEYKRRKQKGQILCIRGGDNQIANGATLLDIKYESYGFSGDLIETKLLIYQYSKVVLVGMFISSVVMCKHSL